MRVSAGGMQTVILHGETEVKGKEVDDWATYIQIVAKCKPPHQKAWLLERFSAVITFALQRAEAKFIQESLCTSFNVALCLVIFVHNAFTSINIHTPYQAVFGGQFRRFPPVRGRTPRRFRRTRQIDIARVREIAAVAIIQAIAKQRRISKYTVHWGKAHHQR